LRNDYVPDTNAFQPQIEGLGWGLTALPFESISIPGNAIAFT